VNRFQRHSRGLLLQSRLISICHGLSRMAIVAYHQNLAMPRSKIDKERGERIRNKIIVDCYNESERFSGWYCHLEEKLKFPFSALCIATSPASPLKRGEQVEVIGLLDDERHEPVEIFVRIRWQRRQMGVPLAQLEAVHVGPEFAQAIADWHYWCSRGYRF
jgi:Calcium binding